MVSKFGLKTEVDPQPYNGCSLQDEEELAKQHKPVLDTLKTKSEVIGHLNKEEPVLIAESKEKPKEEEHVSLVPNIDVSSLTKFKEVIPKVVLIRSLAIASQEHQSYFIPNAANFNRLKDPIELSSWEICLVCIAINNILVKVRGRILSKMWKGEIVGVDQLKDQGSKFLGHIFIQTVQQTRGRVFLKWGRMMWLIYGERGFGRQNPLHWSTENFRTCPLQRNPSHCSDYTRVLLAAVTHYNEIYRKFDL